MKVLQKNPGLLPELCNARVDSAHKPAHGSSTCPETYQQPDPTSSGGNHDTQPDNEDSSVASSVTSNSSAQCLRGDGDSHCNKEFDCNGLGQATCCKNTHQHLQPSHLTNTVYPDQHFWHIWLKKQFLQSIMILCFHMRVPLGCVCLIASMLSSKLWYPSSTPSAGFSKNSLLPCLTISDFIETRLLHSNVIHKHWLYILLAV
jgi:hypothetical protein